MALERIHLRKLLKILFLDSSAKRAAIRSDIRGDIASAAGLDSSGGDFYGPFWSDAKTYVFGGPDLRAVTDDRIKANPNRINLYPQLRDGFLLWWNERRRWTNKPFSPGQSIKARLYFSDLEATVKIDNILSVRDGLADERFVYPYFAPDPTLSEEAARLGLWLLIKALPKIEPDEFRILDVIRGQTFSLDRTPLIGNEEKEFHQRYLELINQRNVLKREYE